MVRLAADTRTRILDSAFTLFGRYGYRRTSMEDIASEAGLSRAALYLQFDNKEAIFRAIAARLHDDAMTGTEAALTANGSLVERLVAAVLAKSLPMVEIATTSPHGSELMDENSRLCGDLANESSKRHQKLLAAAFKQAEDAGEIDLEEAGMKSTDAAELFAAAVHGLRWPEVSVAAYRKRVDAFVKVFVAGLRS